MNTSEHLQAYGVFKPVGHIIVSFAVKADLEGAVAALTDEGFSGADVHTMSSQQMAHQCEADIANASVLATIGQELNVVKALKGLADRGFEFLMVRASGDEKAQRVAGVAVRFHAERAQRFGHLVIEELIAVGTDQRQVAESPARGLDTQTGNVATVASR